jgi:MoaA/NifB/PqqE/SkfB family radical SAM enzyme
LERPLAKDSFTSTGAKYFCHPKAMSSYLEDTGRSVIATHISPEGQCNLNCSYCSVKKRQTGFRIDFPLIQDYIEKLMGRGLKAVTITGGGEPVLYPYFNELVDWLHNEKDLQVGLITNGTLDTRIMCWDALTWIRISLNPGQAGHIYIPIEKLSPDCILGFSYILDEEPDIDMFKKIAKLADKYNVKYIRVSGNCLLKGAPYHALQHKIHDVIQKMDKRFFQQYKEHNAPMAKICHQAYFRPYLSEVDNGTVYPCDSLVLNEEVSWFDRKFQICKASKILDFLDGKIEMRFDPRTECSGCFYSDTVNMLENWRHPKRLISGDCDALIHKDFI